MELDYEEKKRILKGLETGTINFDAEYTLLLNQGFSEEQATEELTNLIEKYKQQLFETKLQQDKTKDIEGFIFIVVMMFSLLGPLLNISNMLWYVIALASVLGLTFWGYKDNLIVGMVKSLSVFFTLPFFLKWYLEGRSSFIQIELIIPIGASLVISYVLSWLIKKMI